MSALNTSSITAGEHPFRAAHRRILFSGNARPRPGSTTSLPLQRCAAASASRKAAPAPDLAAGKRLPECHTNHLSSLGKRSISLYAARHNAEFGELRRLPAAKAMVRPGNAMSEGMLASYSNSRSGIRRSRIGPSSDLPPSQLKTPILISLHSTRYDGIFRPLDDMLRAERGTKLARTCGLSRQGKVGLPNDDGVANADTPSSASQSPKSDNRQARLERAPKP